jgi:hypothetical protein
MAEEQELSPHVSQKRIIGGNHDNNPFKKLIAGFCDPFVQNFDDNATDSQSSSRYAPDLGPQVTSSNTATNGRNNGSHFARGVEGGNGFTNGRKPAIKATTSRVTFEETKVTTKERTHGAEPEEMFSHDGSNTSTEDASDAVSNTDAADSSELAVSNTLTWMRRKRGIEVFVMSFLFVLATLLTLKELGYSIADFDVVVKDSQEFMTGHSKKLIDIVYKSDKTVAVENTKAMDQALDVESSDDDNEPSPQLEEPAAPRTSTNKDDMPDEAPIETHLEDAHEQIIAKSEGSNEL